MLTLTLSRFTAAQFVEIARCPVPGDRAEACAISREKRRLQFLAGRHLLRDLLSKTLGGLPSHWEIRRQPDGPPRLLNAPGICLSVAHSGPWVACTIADRPVGIDVEQHTPGRVIADLAELACHRDEAAELDTLTEEDAILRFLEIWTLKEAWIKQHAAALSPSLLTTLKTTPVTANDTSGQAGSWLFREAEVALALALACDDMPSTIAPVLTDDGLNGSHIRFHRIIGTGANSPR